MSEEETSMFYSVVAEVNEEAGTASLVVGRFIHDDVPLSDLPDSPRVGEVLRVVSTKPSDFPLSATRHDDSPWEEGDIIIEDGRLKQIYTHVARPGGYGGDYGGFVAPRGRRIWSPDFGWVQANQQLFKTMLPEVLHEAWLTLTTNTQYAWTVGSVMGVVDDPEEASELAKAPWHRYGMEHAINSAKRYPAREMLKKKTQEGEHSLTGIIVGVRPATVHTIGLIDIWVPSMSQLYCTQVSDRDVALVTRVGRLVMIDKKGAGDDDAQFPRQAFGLKPRKNMPNLSSTWYETKWVGEDGPTRAFAIEIEVEIDLSELEKGVISTEFMGTMPMTRAEVEREMEKANYSRGIIDIANKKTPPEHLFASLRYCPQPRTFVLCAVTDLKEPSENYYRDAVLETVKEDDSTKASMIDEVIDEEEDDF